MEIAVMESAKRHHELIADLLRKPAALRELDVMRMGRLAIADQARKFRHPSQMKLGTHPARET